MAKYEIILKQYPADDGFPNGYWTATCPALVGCVTDGETREEALAMSADVLHLCLEDAATLDDDETRRVRDDVLREASEENVLTVETHWVEPRVMDDAELATWPTSAHLAPAETT